MVPQAECQFSACVSGETPCLEHAEHDDADSDAPVTDEEQAEVSAHIASVIQGLIEASAGHRQVHARPKAKCRRCTAILAGMQLLDDLESDGPPPTDGGGGEQAPEIVEYEKRAAVG